MKFSILATILGLAALVTADPPAQITFPRCGMNTVITSISSSGCSVTDVDCLCKAKSFVKMANKTISDACKNWNEYKLYVNFINAQCFGQPGYPIKMRSQTESAALRSLSPGIWTAIAAALFTILQL